ncbi:DEAD/DEAH box helicase [Rarobacter incanus]|uniref:Superfamily II DNA/RNA helicase n=1 Tax=Rarobacter incanus TaxID=153494 RepID=A0A542SQ11_9MICO|nr:DEAD/DEAH box helicase [Rarobacter incanus]TQK76665.1 superfamily II DNA/RNA helicase [Rarobacter incanus]
MASFADFALPSAIVSELNRQGLTSPFPIQSASLPDTLAGQDVLGRGRTGSGKTLAFALPTVTRLAGPAANGPQTSRDTTAPAAPRAQQSHPRSGAQARAPRSSAGGHPRALVLCPTRELANQINATIEPLAKSVGLRTTTIFGGVAQSRQVEALRAGADIVIACPGRLEDLLSQRALTLDGIEITVLDEADHMADLGFLPGVKRIMDRTPQRGQRLLFSATLDNGVDQLVRRYLHDPVTHSVDSASSPVDAMTHHFLVVDDAAAKKDLVRELASGTARRILFTRTKYGAKKLAKQLTQAGIPAVDLHGNLSQGARERNLEAFSSGTAKVLVATDIAARGIHVDDVDLVIHVDPPAEHKAYLHRSGRTARAGHDGTVVTIAQRDQVDDVKALMRKAKISAAPRAVTPVHPLVTSLIGERAALIRPTAAASSGSAANSAGRSGAKNGAPRRGNAVKGRARGAADRTDKDSVGSDTKASGARSGGARSQGGGARSQGGGARSQGGGARSQGGGARSQGGGARSQSGGARSQGGGNAGRREAATQGASRRSTARASRSGHSAARYSAGGGRGGR